ncbi:MAG: hypothetical protein QOH09_2432 [Pseudonocardiales bacterium]|jgi:hypothetical protein|nr:hypothetical protein [Pseudonocardiales bacterium]
MRFSHCVVAVTAGIAGSAVLFAGPAIAARFDPSSGSVGDSRLSGPGVAISVAIPAGWRQLPDESHPQLPQMVYPDTCAAGVTCASALASVLSTSAASAQTAAAAAEQAVISQAGIQGATITSEGPIQVAGRSGYYVRFGYSQPNGKLQAETVAIETGPASSGMIPTSLIFVTVSDLAGAPPVSVIDEIVGSTQLIAR